MSRKDRKKASDIFRETEYVFSQKASFKDAFPNIKNLEIRAKEVGGGPGRMPPTSVYDMQRLPGEYIDCSNPICYGGGFSIGGILREMTREGKTDYNGTKVCKGYEGSPKGRKRYRSCSTFWEVEVNLEYH